jgi:hypothetical protein
MYNSLMSGPRTEFDADECQALLDLIDRLTPAVPPEQWVDLDGEQRVALAKLREAGKFYIPESVKR